MALKLTYQAYEFLFDIENLPSQFLKDIEEFRNRNKIVGEICCKKCFNAHSLKKAKELKIGDELIIRLKESMQNEIGHNGYYLDDDKLIRL